jgi:hypothetical protein
MVSEFLATNGVDCRIGLLYEVSTPKEPRFKPSDVDKEV